MMNSSFPLFDVFSELRLLDFQIGVQEYALALKALSGGFGSCSRRDLIFMCQTIWGKTREEQVKIAGVINKFLPEELTADQFKQIVAQFEKAEADSGKKENSQKEKPAEPSETKNRSTVSSESEKDRPSQLPEDKSKKESGQKKENAQDSFSGSTETIPGGADIGSPETEIFQLDPEFDFTGILPITRRQMKRAWRSYRRLQRTGTPKVLDIRKTIEQIYHTGSIANLILVPHRSNMARLLIFADEDGSMTPFRYIIRELLDSAMHSGFAKAAVLYFHNVPEDGVFDDSLLTSRIEIDNVLATFRNEGILIISDAGSARGGYNMDRAESTFVFIQRIKSFTLNIAWLNPTPADRWDDTTADLICKKCEIPMFTMDRSGLDKAMTVLRGKTN